MSTGLTMSCIDLVFGMRGDGSDAGQRPRIEYMADEGKNFHISSNTFI